MSADGAEVMTVEGLSTVEGLHPPQEAFREAQGLQCGFARLIVLVNALRSLREGERAPADPWDGRTLEWRRA